MPENFYPAVAALLDIDEGPEPALLDYIATDPDRSRTGWENAIYTLWVLRFHHTANPAGTILSLKAKRSQLTNVAEINRTTEAIRFFAAKYCGDPKSHTVCEAEANSP